MSGNNARASSPTSLRGSPPSYMSVGRPFQALSMAPAVEPKVRDDRMSLLKSLHRPYGQMDNTELRRNSRDHHPQILHQQHQYNQNVDKPTCGSRQRIVTFTALGLGTLLVVFFVFITTFGKVPNSIQETSFESSDISAEEYVENQRIEVKTNCGHLQGTVEDGAYVFKGIPYAKPPVGQLRWRKPVPVWIDYGWCNEHRIQKVSSFGSPCFQLNPYTKQYEGKEDCLYLNVWTPRLNHTNYKNGLEVMVWIHGGFLQFGSGHDKGLSPTARLAKKLNVVFVSFNYRLYTLGFMALDILSDNVITDSKGNYGIWDQLCALQWIKDNIRSFGGDPKKVTLFGPDSGAAAIMAQMTSPKAQGLFRSVWLVGPTMIFNKSFAAVSAHNRDKFLLRSGCLNAQCLRNSLPQKMIAAHLDKDDASFRIRDQNDLPIQGIFPEQLIIVDGDLFKYPPSEGFVDKQGKTIPILIGTAAQAVDFWPGPDDLSSWTWSQYKKYVTTSLDSFGLQVSKMALSIYNGTARHANNPEFTAEYLYTTMVSDIRQSCPINEVASKLAKSSRSPVFRYFVKSTPSTPANVFNYRAKYSFHMWDLIAFFDQMEHFVYPPTSEDYSFRDLIHRTVMTFVKSGGQDAGDPQWLRYSKTSAFISSSNITYGPADKTECKFWSMSGLGIYAWVS